VERIGLRSFVAALRGSQGVSRVRTIGEKMNRTSKAVLGVAAALALTAVSVSPAAASEKYPKKDGWQYENVSVEVPAGYACDKAVQYTQKGHYKIIEKSSTRSITKAAADYRMKLENVATGKTIKRDISGDFDDRYIHGGRDIKTYATGKNVYFGLGVTGILWADGKQKVYFNDYADPALSLIVVDSTKGRTQELCRQVGLRAVPGKNLPAEEAPTPATLRAARR
jgi:hypothetical protein